MRGTKEKVGTRVRKTNNKTLGDISKVAADLTVGIRWLFLNASPLAEPMIYQRQGNTPLRSSLKRNQDAEEDHKK